MFIFPLKKKKRKKKNKTKQQQKKDEEENKPSFHLSPSMTNISFLYSIYLLNL